MGLLSWIDSFSRKGEENISGVFGKELKNPLLAENDAPFDFIYADQPLALQNQLSDLKSAARTAEADADEKGELFMRKYIAPPRRGARLAYARAVDAVSLILSPLLLAQYLIMLVVRPIFNKIKSIVIWVFQAVINHPIISIILAFLFFAIFIKS